MEVHHEPQHDCDVFFLEDDAAAKSVRRASAADRHSGVEITG